MALNLSLYSPSELKAIVEFARNLIDSTLDDTVLLQDIDRVEDGIKIVALNNGKTYVGVYKPIETKEE